MKSLLRGKRLITIMLIAFLLGMLWLIITIQTDAAFYISNSGHASYGMVYDRDGDVLFDGVNGCTGYESGHFADIGNLIGDTSGQMSNTLVARNLELLTNYSFTTGLDVDGKSAIYSTLDHAANQAVFQAFGAKDGTAIAFNYKTGELLVCVSRPCVDVATGYADLAEGSLICKSFFGMVPGSTQKVSTLIAAIQEMGEERLFAVSYACSGSYVNASGQAINCHLAGGHGTQNIVAGFENSCNPFFAQLVESADMSLDGIISTYTQMGYAVNGSAATKIYIDGIKSETASTTLTDTDDFDTQWGCMGQGETLVSPCQLMLWQSAIANGTGIATMPHLIDEVTNVSGKVVQTAETLYSEQLFTKEAAALTREIMLQNGADRYAEKLAGYTVGVKSGTAQVKNGDEENSLLVGFTADNTLPIAFCVLIENRVSGEVTTDQIVKIMLDALNA